MGDLFSITNEGAAPAAPFVVVQMAGAPRGKGDQDQRIITPKPGSKSWAKGRRKPFAVRYVDAVTESYMKELAMRASVAMAGRGRTILPLGTPIGVRLFAMMPVPQSWSQKKRDAALAGTILPTVKPDWDNIGKMLDAFKGVVWADDQQVCRTLVVKEYAERPGIIVEVYTLP